MGVYGCPIASNGGTAAVADLWQQGGFAVALALTLTALGVLWHAFVKMQRDRVGDLRNVVAQNDVAFSRLAGSVDRNTDATDALREAILNQGLRPRRPTGQHAT